MVPWWNITSFVGSSILQGHEGVLLLGLDFGVWYHPLRVVRQMGRKQLIPSVGTCIKLPMAIGGLETADWLFRWTERPKWRVPNVRALTSVSRAYSQWVICKDPREKERLKIAEKEGEKSAILGKRKFDASTSTIFDRVGDVPEASSIQARLKPKDAPKVFARLTPSQDKKGKPSRKGKEKME